MVNGAPISGETQLEHNDRIVVGSTHIWIFQNPLEKGIDKKHYPPITYEYAQEEIAAKAGINIDTADSADVALLHEDLIGEFIGFIAEVCLVSLTDLFHVDSNLLFRFSAICNMPL